MPGRVASVACACTCVHTSTYIYIHIYIYYSCASVLTCSFSVRIQFFSPHNGKLKIPYHRHLLQHEISRF